MILDKGIRNIGLYRAMYYLPSILGASIAIAILWRQIFTGDGVFNVVLSYFGIKGPNWLFNPDYSIYTLVVLAMWQFGTPMLIFLAGLRAIPQELYEAAEIDAASKPKQFFAITLPLLAPVIFFNLVLQMIDAFKTFSSAFIISNGAGQPGDSLLFFTIYLFNEAFRFFRMGYASALAWVLLIIIAVFTAISFLTSKYWVHYENERD
jgi:multiple sugar transport system permease protein